MRYSFDSLSRITDLKKFISCEIEKIYTDQYDQYTVMFNPSPMDIIDKQLFVDIDPFCPYDVLHTGTYKLIYNLPNDQLKCPLNVNNNKYMELSQIMLNSVKFLNKIDNTIYSTNVFQSLLGSLYGTLFPKYKYFNQYSSFDKVYNIALNQLSNINDTVFHIDEWYKFCQPR